MVNIIHIGLGINKLDEVFDNAYNVFPGKDLGFEGYIKAQFLVDPVTANIAKVISLIGEE